MRIDTTAKWLLVASLSDAVMGEEEQEQTLCFDIGDFTSDFIMNGQPTSIFIPNKLQDYAKTFNWNMDSKMSVQSVDIFQEQEAVAPTRLDFKNVTDVNTGAVIGGNVTLNKGYIDKLSQTAKPFYLVVNWTAYEGAITGSSSGSGSGSGSTRKRATMMLEGTAYSQELAVVQNAFAASAVYSSYPSALIAGASPVKTAIVQMITVSASPTRSPTDTPANSETTPSPSSSLKSSSTPALSTGAIAGIAVGGAALLALTGALTWFLCLRRRRNRDNVHSTPYGAGGSRGQHTQDLIAEKEANAGIAEVPYTSHSTDHHLRGPNESGVDLAMAGENVSHDDYQLQLNTGSSNRNSAAPVSAVGLPHTPRSHERTSLMGSPVAASTPPDQRTYSAYRPSSPLPGTAFTTDKRASQHQHQQHGQPAVEDEAASSSSYHNNDEDHANAADGSAAARSRGVSPHTGGRSATPSGISGRYAHLVEEGMTGDEIRRLEDEERQIDMAIEEAGRGR